MTLTSSFSGGIEGEPAEVEDIRDRKCRQLSPVALLNRAEEKWCEEPYHVSYYYSTEDS